MRMLRRSLVIGAAVVAAAVLAGTHFAGSASPASAGNPLDTFAIDCDASTVAVDSVCNVPVNAVFTIGFSSTSVSADEGGWQLVMDYTDSVVSYASIAGLMSTAPVANSKSGNLSSNPGISCAPDATLQSPPIPENSGTLAGTGRIFATCVGNAPAVNTPELLGDFVFQCGATAGAATLHIKSPTEDILQGGSGLIDFNTAAIRFDSGTDATVNCALPPTATATALPTNTSAAGTTVKTATPTPSGSATATAPASASPTVPSGSTPGAATAVPTKAGGNVGAGGVQPPNTGEGSGGSGIGGRVFWISMVVLAGLFLAGAGVGLRTLRERRLR